MDRHVHFNEGKLMNTNKTILPIGIAATLGLLGLFASTNATLSTAPSLTQASLSSAELWNRSELYFGSGKPDGSNVSEKQFRQFVDAEVTPRFPDGLTLLTGYGQYKNSSGKIVKEQSFVLVILYQGKDANAKLETIRKAYKRAFKQESVLRVDDTTRVSF
jgi:Protein of unknown function (DUF3574)